MQRIIKYSAVIFATLTLLLVFWQFKLVLFLFVMSLFAAATIRPFVDAIVARGIPRGTAQILLLIFGLVALVLIILLAGEFLLQELNLAANRVTVEYEALYQNWESGANWQQSLASALPEPFTFEVAQETDLDQMIPVMLNITRGLTSALGGAVLLLVFSVYWSIDQYRFERLWLSLLPVKYRAFARDSWRKMESAVGSYIRNQSAQSLMAFLILIICGLLTGFNYPLLLGFVGAVCAFIPLFGGLIAAVFTLVLGSIESTTVALSTAAVTLLVFIFLELIVEPRLWPRQRRNFLLTILVLLPLFEAFGFWGLLVAPPLAAAVEVIVSQTYQIYIDKTESDIELEDLLVRHEQLSNKISQTDNQKISPELQNLNQRLTKLLAESKQFS